MDGGAESSGHEGRKPSEGERRPSEPFLDFRASHWVEAALTLVLLGFTGFQVCIYRQQTEIMRGQSKISDQQLTMMHIDQRPWITIKGMTASWPVKNGTEIKFDRIDTRLVNVGKSAAYTLLEAEAVIDPNEVWKRRLRICKSVQTKAEHGDWGIVHWAIFPSLESPYAALNARVEDATPDKLFTPWVVGCIAYQSTADKNDSVHATPFAAYLSVEDPAHVVENAPPNPIDLNAIAPPPGKVLVGKSVGSIGGN